MSAKKYLISFVALFAFLAGAKAQYNPYWQWAKADTSSALAYAGGSSVLGVKNGKVLWGRMTSNQTVVNGVVMGTWTFTEYDSTGRQTNSAAFGGKVEMIDAQADAQGNWYILGRFYDTLLLPGITLLRNTPATNPDADHFILRLRGSSFVMDWYRLIGTLKSTYSRAFTIDNSKIIIAVDSTDATYVRSMDFSTGLSTPMFKQGGKSQTSSIVTDAAGNVYMAGSCADKAILDFNGTSHPLALGSSNAYMVRYRPNYSHAWDYVMNDRGCAQRKLSLFKNQYLFYTGSIQDSLTLGGTSLHQPYTSMGFLTARLDTMGSIIWARQSDTFGGGEAWLGQYAFHAVVTPDTALVLFAQANSYMNWGNGVTTNLFGGYGSVVVSSDINGTTRWARSILGDNVTDTRLVGEGDAVWVSGNSFTNTAFTLFDTLSLRMPARKWVPYLGKLKLVQPPFIPKGVSGVNRPTYGMQPNPARTAIMVAGLNGKTNISLVDATGRAVLELTTDKHETLLDVARLPRGMYVLQVANGAGATEARKIVLE